jgi:hypothetical protein
MGRKHRSVPKEAGESGEVRKLKDANRRLKSDKAKLISEISTLKEAFNETRHFIDEKLDKVDVSKVIRAIKEAKKLKEINNKDGSLNSDLICEGCNRPFKVLFTSITRTIYNCADCKIRRSEYNNQELYGEEENF